MKKKSLIFAILALLATGFIFYNSMKTAAESSASSGTIVNMIIDWFSHINKHLDRDTITVLVRKTAHVVEFFMQGLFISLAYYFGKYSFSKRIVYLLFWGLLTACTDELIQNFFHGRAGLVYDIWIDFIGVLLAAVLYFIITALSGRKKLR